MGWATLCFGTPKEKKTAEQKTFFYIIRLSVSVERKEATFRACVACECACMVVGM